MAGITRVFEIGQNFRNEDIDATHNPEFTMMEIYQAYTDYNDMMNLTEDIITFSAQKTFGKLKFNYKGMDINLKKPWKRITMYDSLREYAGIDVEKLSDAQLKELIKKYEIEIPGGFNRGLAIAELFEELVQPKLINPTFVTDYPRETTPLCKIHRDNPELIERFELFIAGIEIANGYTELNDPITQRKFFEEQEKMRKAGYEEAYPYDRDFVEAMEYGMPPAGGVGIGLDTGNDTNWSRKHQRSNSIPNGQKN